jgi:type I restriction enzyme M protein
MAVSTTIKSIQDIMRKDAGTYGDAQRIEQLAWMFFLKIVDDRETEQELMDDDFKSPLPQKYRWRNWAADEEGLTGEKLLDFIDNGLLKDIKTLAGVRSDPRVAVIRNAFDDANNYMKNGTLMRQVVNKINEIDFNNSKDRHLFGDVYEQILKDLQSAGNAGEFYTPRAVTQFMVQQTAPQLGERILDPACGTGGFLTAVIDYVRDETKQVKKPKQEEKLQASIHGVEKKHLPHILCTTNLLLHGIDVPSQILHDNTLSRPLRDYGPKDRVDVIVTNPPFGGMEEDGIELNFPKAFQTRETADLFLVLIMHLLKDGGRGAIVLPDGTLFGEGVKTRIKEKLLDECNLHTIVRLPNGVFNPYTGIKTNLLFFTKGTPTKDIWFYEHPYPPGAKSYNKTKPIRIEEFDAEKKWWGKPDTRGGFKGRKESELAWKVTAAEIKENGYNLDIKNPNTADTGLGDPDELLAELASIRTASRQTLDQLKGELAAALAPSSD